MLLKALKLVGLMALVATIGVIGYGVASGGSAWERTDMSDGSYSLTKYSGGSFVEERGYNSQGKLFLRRYTDMQMRSHITTYDPETGKVVDDSTY